MAYCVHCGVKLDESCKRCPLCQTLIIDPNEYEQKDFIPKASSPFPVTRGEIEKSGKIDFAILFSVILGGTAVTCFLLNWLAYNDSWWSFYIIGICAVLWILIFPPITFKKITIYSYLLMDYVSITLYLFLLSMQLSNGRWFFPIALPISTSVFILICLILFFLKRFKYSFLSTALYIILSVGIQSVTIEIALDRYFYNKISLSWSAVVLTVVIIISLALTTILSNPKLRKSFRKRFHFCKL